MRSTKLRFVSRRRIAQLGVILLFGAMASSLAHWMEERRLTVFNQQSSFSVSIAEREGKDYVAIADLLERLGATETISSTNDRVKLRFESREVEFQAGESVAAVGQKSVKIAGKVLIDSGRVLVPLPGVQALLEKLVDQSLTYRAESRRLFVGDSGIRFALELRKAEGTQLILSFTTPVSPQIQSEPGRLKMVFSSDALLMGTQRWQFDDDVITSAEYHDAAEPELRVLSAQPLLATFADNGKTIVVAPAPGPTVDVPSSTRPLAASVDSQPDEEAASAAVTTPIAPTSPIMHAVQERYLVVIDASHGGRERGAELTEKLAEKDVTLAFARSLRQQLNERGLSSLMVRDADNTLTPDQRAVLANTSQAAVYLAIHAGGLERGVRIYTSMLSSDNASSGPFVPWEKAQANFLRSSRLVGASILDELGKSRVRVPAAPLPAPVRPLNNVAAAAVAVEVGPLSDDMATVNNPDYQEVIAKALASALVAVRPRVERAR